MLVRVGDGPDPHRQGEHDMEVRDAEQLGLAIHASACDPWHFGFAECGRQAGRRRRWRASVNLDPASVAQRLWQQTRLEHPTIGTSLHRLLLFQHSPGQPHGPGMLPLPSMPLSFRTKQAAMGVDVVAGGELASGTWGHWPPGALPGVAVALPAARAAAVDACLMSISQDTIRSQADARSWAPCSLERAHPRTAGAGCGTGFLTRSRPGILAERGGAIVRGIGSPDRSQCRAASEAAGARIDDVVVSFPARRQACRHRHHRGPNCCMRTRSAK
jgi:hypothetical protein